MIEVTDYNRVIYKYFLDKAAINLPSVAFNLSILSTSNELVVYANDSRGMSPANYYGPFETKEDVDVFISLMLMGAVDKGPKLQVKEQDPSYIQEVKLQSLRDFKNNGYRQQRSFTLLSSTL